MNSFLRPFGQPLIHPIPNAKIEATTDADIRLLLTLLGNWQSAHELMKATGIGLRRTRTAMDVAMGRGLVESRTRRAKNRANSHEEYQEGGRRPRWTDLT